MSTGTPDHRQVRILYEQHGAALLAYAVALLQDRAAAEDALHQVFVKLLQGRVGITGEPLHYLYRAVRNTAFNYQRSHSRELSLGSNGHWLEAPPGFEEAGLAIQAALKELPVEQREVIVLRVWGQLTFEETALALDIPSSTAASRYRYGLAKLRERLAPLEKE